MWWVRSGANPPPLAQPRGEGTGALNAGAKELYLGHKILSLRLEHWEVSPEWVASKGRGSCLKDLREGESGLAALPSM
jgi:hypothetical protein